ncbi:FeoA family protein [Bacillus sp. 03113]|uniref:FeoA family protein n=1 Tax=Bacillus sp. 03113 TaxID=2578211 RepID=UPI0011444240|nr:FeoA family protein [Bacillus sp. 03113]
MLPSKLLPLSKAKTGDSFKISQIKVDGTLRRRLLDLGFVPNAIIHVLQKSPLGDPTAYRVSQTTIALRKEESSNIFGELMSHE